MLDFLAPTKTKIIWTIIIFLIISSIYFVFLNAFIVCGQGYQSCPGTEYPLLFDSCQPYVCTEAEQISRLNENIISAIYTYLPILLISYLLSAGISSSRSRKKQ